MLEFFALRVTNYNGKDFNYSRTFRKRPPKMSILGGRLRKVVAYGSSDDDWVKILPPWAAETFCAARKSILRKIQHFP